MLVVGSAQCVDQYFVKYAATAVALLVYAAPLWLRDAGQRGSRDDLTQDYIRAMRLLQNTSRCGFEEFMTHACILYSAQSRRAFAARLQPVSCIDG